MSKPTKKELEISVDELGKIKAEVSKLKKQEEKIKLALISSKWNLIEGKLFRCTISRYDRKSIDMDSIRENYDQEWIDFHSKTSEVTKVNVSSLKST